MILCKIHYEGKEWDGWHRISFYKTQHLGEAYNINKSGS